MTGPLVAKRPKDATTPTMVGSMGRGLLLGLGWGVLARVFMRLFATTPEFSWAGTLLIIGLSMVLWCGLELVAGARRAGRSRWWLLAPLPGLMLFASPGMLLLPGALGTALTLALRHRPLLLRLAPLALGLVVTLLPVLGTGDGDGTDAPFAAFGAGQDASTVLGLGLLVAATLGLGWGFHTWWRRWPAPPAQPVMAAATEAAGAPTPGGSTAADGNGEGAQPARSPASRRRIPSGR